MWPCIGRIPLRTRAVSRQIRLILASVSLVYIQLNVSDLARFLFQVAERLALSFNTSRKLNKLVDEHLPPARPRFERHEIVVAGETFEVFFRDVLACIKSLFSDPEFAPILLLVPERH